MAIGVEVRSACREWLEAEYGVKPHYCPDQSRLLRWLIAMPSRLPIDRSIVMFHSSLMKQFFSYKGRMGRAKFAMIYLAAFVLMVLAVFLGDLLLRITESSSENTAGAMSLKVFVYGICALLIWFPVWILSASWAKRLHDIGVTGWYQLILLVPVFNYLMLVVFFLPGTSAANKYGERS